MKYLILVFSLIYCTLLKAQMETPGNTSPNPDSSGIMPSNFKSGPILNSFVLWSGTLIQPGSYNIVEVCPPGMCASVQCTISSIVSCAPGSTTCSGGVPDHEWYNSYVTTYLQYTGSQFLLLLSGDTIVYRGNSTPTINCVVWCQSTAGVPGQPAATIQGAVCNT